MLLYLETEQLLIVLQVIDDNKKEGLILCGHHSLMAA